MIRNLFENRRQRVVLGNDQTWRIAIRQHRETGTLLLRCHCLDKLGFLVADDNNTAWIRLLVKAAQLKARPVDIRHNRPAVQRLIITSQTFKLEEVQNLPDCYFLCIFILFVFHTKPSS